MTYVARELGRGTREVWHEPWHLVLWDFWQLQEIEDHERAIEDLRDVNRAGMHATGWHTPKELSKYEQEAKRRAGMLPSVETVRRRALEQDRRIRAGRVLNDGD